jgi:hypothetical protein
MRRIILTGLGALLAVALYLPQAQALMVAPECSSDADCEEGWFCDANCTDMACEDPDDPACGECLGWCSFIDDGDPWQPENECETDADCTDGFACVEAQSPTIVTDVPVNPTDPGQEPCPEGEKCDDAGDDSEGSGGSSGEAKEEPPSTDPPEPTTWKYCEPKSCDTDAECGGDLVCVLETYACLDAPAKMAPTPDCPPDEEDCGGSEPGPDTETDPDPCEPETVGHCAPKWMAPCDADADCGPGFACVEEEICYGWAIGSPGSAPSVPTEPTDCDPDDEDCGTDTDDSQGEASDPVDPDGKDDEPTSGEECELTGHFYCELQLIDCSSEACPDGLVCHEVRNEVSEPCWETSDGETNCPDGEPVDDMMMVCVPEDFEDWAGAGMKGGGYNEGTPSTDNGTPADPEEPEAGDDEESSGGGGGGGGGCAGGSPSAPMSGFALALLALGLVTRRRV